MKKSRLFLLLVVLSLAITGVALYLMAPSEGQLFPHPLSGLFRELHGVAVALGIYMLGFMSADHVKKKWAKHKYKWDGFLHLSLWLVLVVTGLLLYYPQEGLGDIPTSALHWYAGLLLCAVYSLHSLRSRLVRLVTRKK